MERLAGLAQDLLARPAREGAPAGDVLARDGAVGPVPRRALLRAAVLLDGELHLGGAGVRRERDGREDPAASELMPADRLGVAVWCAAD